MSLTKSIQRLQKLHLLISEQKTGTPKELAKKLGISRSYLYIMIEDVKMLNMHVIYSRKNKTFFYEIDNIFDISLNIKKLSNDELRNTNAGLCTFLLRSTISDGTNLSLYSYLAECKE